MAPTRTYCFLRERRRKVLPLSAQRTEGADGLTGDPEADAADEGRTRLRGPGPQQATSLADIDSNSD